MVIIDIGKILDSFFNKRNIAFVSLTWHIQETIRENDTVLTAYFLQVVFFFEN